MAKEFDREQWIRNNLAQTDAATLDDRVARAMETRVHEIMPGYFGGASTECRDDYVDGHYYSCISLAKAVAEGISKYVTDRNKIKRQNDFPTRVRRLKDDKFITEAGESALLRIWGSGSERNDFLHMNPEVETDHQRLKQRARECVDDLFTVESYLFARKQPVGPIEPVFPRYWDFAEDGSVAGFWIRCHVG